MIDKPIIGLFTLASMVNSHENPCFLKPCHVDPPDMGASSSWFLNYLETSKFHVGLLSVSLLAGLAYGGFVAYCCFVKENILLSHIRNLVIALTCRTFFTLLVHSVIVLEGSGNVEGNNTLVAFESISLNLVVSFWLFLTIYLHARVQNNFNSEPNLTAYKIAVLSVGVYFALVYIFTMAGAYSCNWFPTWFFFCHWITSSLQLLFHLIQLGLVIDMGRMVMMKYSLDSDSTTLFRQIAALMVGMVFLFWLHFGLSVGRPSTDGYLYFHYLIGGLQCAALCPIFYFFEKWVVLILDKISNLSVNLGESHPETRAHRSDKISIDQGIVTIDSLLTERENENWRGDRQIIEERKDVVYSSVVQPENLKKTIDLYKRLNVLPKHDVTVIGGDEFYECLSERKNSNISEMSESTTRHVTNLTLNNSKISYEERTVRQNNKKINNSELDKVKKKNAFYSSKYLIIEPKEKDLPKYLESRPSSSSADEESLRGDRKRADTYNSNSNSNSGNSGNLSAELVKNWLNECSNGMERKLQKPSSRQKNDSDFDRNNRKESDSVIASNKSSRRTSQASETCNSRASVVSVVDGEGQKTVMNDQTPGSNDPAILKDDKPFNT